MKIKRFSILLFCLVFCVLCTACNGKTPSDNPVSPLSTPSTAPSSPEPTGTIGNLPSTKNILVSREGEEESLLAHLKTSEAGYSIYVFEDFNLVSTDDGDMIIPKADSVLMKTITMRIARSNGASALPKNYVTDGIHVQYHRVEKGAYIFDVELTYPIEAAEGGKILLLAMLGTLSVE